MCHSGIPKRTGSSLIPGEKPHPLMPNRAEKSPSSPPTRSRSHRHARGSAAPPWVWCSRPTCSPSRHPSLNGRMCMKPGIVHLMRVVHRVCRSRVRCPSTPCARWPMGQVHRTGAGDRVLVCKRPDYWREVSAAGLRVVAGLPDDGRGTPTPSALLVVTAPRSGAESDRPSNGRTRSSCRARPSDHYASD